MTKGKALLLGLIGLSLVPILLTALNLLSIQAYDAEEVILFVGSMFGLIAFMIMWWQYVLGARFVLKLFTNDYLWSINIHKLLGKYGFLLILVHPVLIYVDRIVYGLGITLPNLSLDYDRNVFLGQITIAVLGVIWLMSAIIRDKFSYRFWKRIHLVNYSLLFFIFIHSIAIGSFLKNSSSTWFVMYWFFLFAIFVIITISRLLFQFGILKSKYAVVEVEKITHDTFTLKLVPKSNRLVPLKGQFVYIQNTLTGEAHPYTVSYFNEVTGDLHISTKNLGRFSLELQNLKPGVEVYLDGPYGVFTQEAYKSERPIVLIAGGIGITPFIRLIDYFVQHPEKNPGITLFYGNKSEEDIAFKEMVDTFQPEKFKVVHVLSLQESVGDGYEKGFITAALIKEYLSDLQGKDYFLCGPPIMVKKLVPDLIFAGIPERSIYSEKFSM